MMTILSITGGKELLDNGGAGKRPVMTLTIRGEDEHTSVGALAMQLIALIHGANDAELMAKLPKPVAQVPAWWSEPTAPVTVSVAEQQELQRKAEEAAQAASLQRKRQEELQERQRKAQEGMSEAWARNKNNDIHVERMPIDPNAPVQL